MSKVGAVMGAKHTKKVLFLAALAVTIAIPLAGSNFTAFIFALGLIYGLAAMSLSMLTGWVGQASLGHAAFAGGGAFLTAKLQEHGWPFLAIMPVVVAGALALSMAVGIPALRIRGLQLAVVTLAFGYTVERAVFEQLSGGYSNDTVVHRPQFFGVDFLKDKNYFLCVLGIVMFLTLLANNIRTRTMGRGMMAVRESETVFSHVGGNVASYKLAGFCISAVYASMAGILLGGLIANINKDAFNLQFGLFIVSVAIVGGMGSLIGPYIAGIAFAWYPQLFAGIEAFQYWTYMLGGVGMILFVLVLPGGLAGVPEQVAKLQHLFVTRGGKKTVEAQAADDDESVEIDLTATILDDDDAEHRRTSHLADAPHLSLSAGEHLSRRRDRTVGGDGEVNPDVLLEMQSISIAFGGTVALSDVSFTVAPREIHGLVGPNGAGKSTLFNCITGIYKPNAGHVLYRGIDLIKLPPHRRARLGIARTFQNINVLPNLSVLENCLVAEQAHWSGNLLRDALGFDANHRQEMVRRTAESNLEFLGLMHLRNTQAKDLSHGTLKLVELARAMTSQPDLLLLDEPAAGLSMAESERLGEVLQQLRDELELTILIVEHDMALVMGNCNRVTVLDYGRVLASGSPDDVRQDPAVIAAYLGTTEEEEEVLAQ